MIGEAHKYGFVVQFRVNTENCQNVLDVAQLLGVPTEGVSFGSIVSTVLAACMESWRQSGSLPALDPFQYGPRMEPYRDAKNTKGKGKGKSYASRAKNVEPNWMRGTIASPVRPAQAYQLTPEELAFQQAEAARLPQSKGVVRDGVWMGERGGLMRPEDGLPSEWGSAADEQYPDTTEAHEVASDDALAERYLALHRRREVGALSEDEQAEYLRLNHLLFDGK